MPIDDTKIEKERTLLDRMVVQINDLPIKREQAKMRIKTEQQKQKDRYDKGYLN